MKNLVWHDKVNCVGEKIVPFNGFSRLSKKNKIDVVSGLFSFPERAKDELMAYWHVNKGRQKLFDEFSENTVSNYYLPYGVVPNVLVNERAYMVPMVTEESSVVAAVGKSAKFWMMHGGFHARVKSMDKSGQVHFLWDGGIEMLKEALNDLIPLLIRATKSFIVRMVERGGGVRKISFVDLRDKMDDYYQLNVSFDTVDSMGANFINSCLEEYARVLNEFFSQERQYGAFHFEVIMAILSNYTPDCRVEVFVETDIESFAAMKTGMPALQFAQKFKRAVDIASFDRFRAVTHNKGVMNGVDAVVLATGNDFRAVEAGVHAWASGQGDYKSLSIVSLNDDGVFNMKLSLPLSLGTVGGITSLHPMARFSLEMLGNPGSEELMKIVASVGLASNFAAVKSLVTQGIQRGHMKMHLLNVLSSLDASEGEKKVAMEYFENIKVSYSNVRDFIRTIRKST